MKRERRLNIGADIHSHLLPGLDDGVKGMDESLSILKKMEEAGYTHIYTSPHIDSMKFHNTPEIILPAFEQWKKAAVEAGINVQLGVHAEYYIDEQFRRSLNEGEQFLCLPGNHLLVEFPMTQEPLFFHQILFELQSRGYKPILAHPERYGYFARKAENYRRLKHTGCLFQVNLLSFSGNYGKEVKKCAKMLRNEGLIDFWGSDLHHFEQTVIFTEKSVYKAVCGLETKNSLFL